MIITSVANFLVLGGILKCTDNKMYLYYASERLRKIFRTQNINDIIL